MSFIVKKKIGNKEYFYLNENKRVNGKVKTKTLAYLGKTKKDAEKKVKDILNILKKQEIKSMKNEGKEIQAEKMENKIEVGKKIDEINKIASTKGFFFQTANIYSGKAGFYT